MKFTKTYYVSSHDFAHNDRIRPSAVLRYMQETANSQLFAEKPSYADLLAMGYAFVVSRLHLKIYEDFHAYETITAETWALPESGASFDRCYRLLRGDTVLAEAYSVWALLNRKHNTLCRAGELPLHYSTDKPLDIPARVKLPKTPLQEVGKRDIRYSDIDCNGHMNNTNYPDMFCDFLPEIDALDITELYIHYVSEARLGETLTVLHGKEQCIDSVQHVFETTKNDGSCNIRALLITSPSLRSV
ncbi:MAG: hypothetical protein J6Q42_04520 [Clostridia bacterium]|jgi:acyl-ACP thioesterase|nr:hypothetical protein [Clostridia bacterium]